MPDWIMMLVNYWWVCSPLDSMGNFCILKESLSCGWCFFFSRPHSWGWGGNQFSWPNHCILRCFLEEACETDGLSQEKNPSARCLAKLLRLFLWNLRYHKSQGSVMRVCKLRCCSAGVWYATLKMADVPSSNQTWQWKSMEIIHLESLINDFPSSKPPC